MTSFQYAWVALLAVWAIAFAFMSIKLNSLHRKLEVENGHLQATIRPAENASQNVLVPVPDAARAIRGYPASGAHGVNIGMTLRALRVSMGPAFDPEADPVMIHVVSVYDAGVRGYRPAACFLDAGQAADQARAFDTETQTTTIPLLVGNPRNILGSIGGPR